MVQPHGGFNLKFEIHSVIPVLRIFDVAKAREFYLDYLGFTVDWEHRFDPDAPLYMQITRDGLVLHLTEHYGDGTPGTVVFVRVQNLDIYHRELAGRNYRYLRPGVQETGHGSRGMELTDPFGNRLRFDESAG